MILGGGFLAQSPLNMKENIKFKRFRTRKTVTIEEVQIPMLPF